MSTLRFEICDAEGAQAFFWRVVEDGDILARSETVYSKASAIHGATKVKENSGTYRMTYEAFLARNGKWDWHAQAANNEIMISSTNYYPTERAAWAAARHVESNASTAVIVDMTRTASRR